MVNGKLVSFKTPLIILTFVVAYFSSLIDIAAINKQRTGSHNYPPAVVALLVSSLLQMIYTVWLLAKAGKGRYNLASRVVAVWGFFFLFNMGSVIATTVLYERRDSHYCPWDSSTLSDCSGCMRGVMALGYSLMGLNLINIGMVAGLVKSHGKWSSELHQLPSKEIVDEKRVVH